MGNNFAHYLPFFTTIKWDNDTFENYLMDQDGSNTKKLSDFKGYTDMQSDSWKIVPKKSTTGSKLVDTSL